MRMKFESGGMSINSHEKFPKPLTEEVLADLETIAVEEVETLDLLDTGEAIGISAEEMSKDLEYTNSVEANIARSNELAEAIKVLKREIEGKSSEEVAMYYERLGHVFEAFLFSNIRDSRIFRDVILHKTTKFDDLKNGIDFVAEVKSSDDPKAYVALAMDASFSMSPALINKKMERSLGRISSNKLSTVKYFEFEKGASEAQLGMPRVIVGTDEYSVSSLLKRWHTKETIAESGVSFEEDPVWTFMALQIKDQLKVFIEEAEFHNKKDIATLCKKYLKSLEVSLRLNRDLVERHEILMKEDGTSIAINEFCKRNSRELVASENLHRENKQSREDDKMYQDAIRKN